MTNEPHDPMAQENEPVSLHRAALQQAGWFIMAGTVVLLLFHSWGDSPLRSAGALQRFAVVALPAIIVASYLDAVAARSAHVAFRAIGIGTANALAFIVILNADRIVSTQDPRGFFLRTLLTVPVLGLFFAVPAWTRATYLEKRPTSDTETGRADRA